MFLQINFQEGRVTNVLNNHFSTVCVLCQREAFNTEMPQSTVRAAGTPGHLHLPLAHSLASFVAFSHQYFQRIPVQYKSGGHWISQ